MSRGQVHLSVTGHRPDRILEKHDAHKLNSLRVTAQSHPLRRERQKQALSGGPFSLHWNQL
jgi:hypothetical protein